MCVIQTASRAVGCPHHGILCGLTSLDLGLFAVCILSSRLVHIITNTIATLQLPIQRCFMWRQMLSWCPDRRHPWTYGVTILHSAPRFGSHDSLKSLCKIHRTMYTSSRRSSRAVALNLSQFHLGNPSIGLQRRLQRSRIITIPRITWRKSIRRVVFISQLVTDWALLYRCKRCFIFNT